MRFAVGEPDGGSYCFRGGPGGCDVFGTGLLLSPGASLILLLMMVVMRVGYPYSSSSFERFPIKFIPALKPEKISNNHKCTNKEQHLPISGTLSSQAESISLKISEQAI